MRPEPEQRRQRVEPPPGGGAWVVGDRTQLLHVLLNLLGNANKFAPEGTRVRIAGARAGAETVLLVEDEGPGLPPGDEASLFGRYRRFGGAARPHGAGLGLWIVHSIVRRHGGSVAAETRADEMSCARPILLVSIPSEPNCGTGGRAMASGRLMGGSGTAGLARAAGAAAALPAPCEAVATAGCAAG